MQHLSGFLETVAVKVCFDSLRFFCTYCILNVYTLFLRHLGQRNESPVRADLQSSHSRVLGFVILQGQIWRMRYFREKVAVF